MTGSLQVLWDEALTHYDFGPEHPMNPVRVALTFSLARELGVLSAPSVTVLEPTPASDAELETVHDPDYIEAVRVYNTELKTFPGVVWASTLYKSNKPMQEFTVAEDLKQPPQVKF